MLTDLTSKQQQLYSYLEKEITRTGKTPSLRTIAGEMGVTHAAVSQLIKTLEEKGVVKRDGYYGRRLLLLNRVREVSGAMRWVEVPIIGSIAAGMPLYAQQEWDGTLVVDKELYPGTNLFALRIKGNSMKDVAILDGDLVICEPRQFAENGEIVVALVYQDEATVKRFFRLENRIELRPENADFAPMTYAFSEVLIQGKVIGVQRGTDVFEKVVS